MRDIEFEYASSAPVSATSSADGERVVIEFPNIEDPSKAMRLAFPSSQLVEIQSALATVQKALADPASGLHLQHPH